MKSRPFSFVPFVAALPLLAASPAAASAWLTLPQNRLSFSSVQTGVPFKGGFAKWSAEIIFDPVDPEAGHIKATIDLASIATGDPQRDSALPQSEWFDIEHFPQAVFEATRFVAKGGEAYEALGHLTIRGVTKDVVLPFTLTIAGDKATAKGHLDLIRTNFGIGQGVWSSGQWVALEAGVDVEIIAAKIGS
jgi:polyisoprenoid-binding protein YceI